MYYYIIFESIIDQETDDLVAYERVDWGRVHHNTLALRSGNTIASEVTTEAWFLLIENFIQSPLGRT